MMIKIITLLLGVGTPGSCEAAVHVTRRFNEAMPDYRCVVKLDFSNAFNSLHRDVMLEAVLENVPAVYMFYYSSHNVNVRVLE